MKTPRTSLTLFLVAIGMALYGQPNLTLNPNGFNQLTEVGNGTWSMSVTFMNNGNATSPPNVDVQEYLTLEPNENNLDYFGALHQPLICETVATLPALAPGQSFTVSFTADLCEYTYYTGAFPLELHWCLIVDPDQLVIELDDSFADNSAFWPNNVAPSLQGCPCQTNQCPTLLINCASIYDPVCGCDGVTYGNECEARYYSPARTWTPGECQTSCTNTPQLFCNDVYQDSNDPSGFRQSGAVTTDAITVYNPCNSDGHKFEGSTSTSFFEHEVVYALPNAFGHMTVDVKPAFFDLDVDLFIQGDCPLGGGGGNNFQDVNGDCQLLSTRPRGQNDAVFIEDFQNNGTLYAVVDGPTQSNNLFVEGDYTIALTCGYLQDHSFDVTELPCGDWIDGRNDVANYASYYFVDPESNKGGNWGPERVYSFEISETRDITVTLEMYGGQDLNLYLLEDLSATSQGYLSKLQGRGDEQIDVTLDPGRYYVIVEGYCGAIDDYRIRLDGCGDLCTDCSWCFDYCLQPGVEGSPDYYEFASNFCQADPTGIGFFITSGDADYNWDFPAGAVAEFVLGTDATSAVPRCRFNPGRWRVCLTISYPGGSYTCCTWVRVDPRPCPPLPPICDLRYEIDSDGRVDLDASASIGAESFTWLVEDTDTRDTIVNSFSDFYEQQITVPVGRCYLITVYVSNCFGTSKRTVKVCRGNPDCAPPNSGGGPLVLFWTEGDEIYFDDVPAGYDSYEWNVPSDFNFITGDASSRGWRCGIPPSRTYKVCLTLRRGCEVYCYCWTVSRGCRPNTPCSALELNCDNYLDDDNLSVDAFYKSDLQSTYHQHGCFEFKTSSGQAFTPLFRSIESTYSFSPFGGPRPVTIDVYNRDMTANYDPDIFLFDGCSGSQLNTCVDYSGHLPPGLNESVFIPTAAWNNEIVGDIYAVVDGQSFSSGAVNEGRYTIGVTCGPISDGPFITGYTIPDLECEQPYSSSTASPIGLNGNFASYYSCDPETDRGNNWGPERLHRYTVPLEGVYTFTLDHTPGEDLNLYLLSELSSQSCQALSKRHVGNREEITILLSPGEYYLVVDGYAGSFGDYTMTVSGCSVSKVTFDLGEVCGGVNTTVDVPVTVSGFEDIFNWAFEVNLPDNAISLIDIVDIDPRVEEIGGSFAIFGSNRLILSWEDSSGNPVTLPDNTVICYLRCRINQDFAGQYILIADTEEIVGVEPTQICVDQGSICITDDVMIAGRVETPNGNPDPNQEVRLSGAISRTTITDAQGRYQFDNVPPGTYTVSCFDDANLREGVSIADVSAIRRHFLEKTPLPLDTDYKLLAGDISRDGRISIADVSLTRRVFLERISTLPANTSWRFVGASTDISSDPMDPSRPDEVQVVANADQLNVDIIAVKVGDVNNSLRRRTLAVKDLVIEIDDVNVETGDSFSVALSADLVDGLSYVGFQMTIDSSVVRIDSITSPLTGFTSGAYTVLSDRVIVGWDEPSGESYESTDDLLMVIHATVVTDMEQVVQLGLTSAEAADRDYNTYDPVTTGGEIAITLSTSTSEWVSGGNALSVYPNPFIDKLVIDLETLHNNHVDKLMLYDVNGNIVYSGTDYLAKRTDIRLGHLPSGVYIVKAVVGSQVLSRQIIKL